MIHYHGMPISRETVALRAIQAGHAFVNFNHKSQLRLVVEVAQSFAIDNGAFSAWTSGNPRIDWQPFYEWANECATYPNFDFAVIPDVIDGDEKANDDLINQWPLSHWHGAPVWHLHESLDRLKRLAAEWPRICIGSSGMYGAIGTSQWWTRMDQAMRVTCDREGKPKVKLHGLRMLNPKIFTKFPFASADSTNIGRNVNIDKKWNGTYQPLSIEVRAEVMRSRIESFNSPSRYRFSDVDLLS